MAEVILKKVEKQYPNGFKAVHGIDLDIKGWRIYGFCRTFWLC